MSGRLDLKSLLEVVPRWTTLLAGAVLSSALQGSQPCWAKDQHDTPLPNLGSCKGVTVPAEVGDRAGEGGTSGSLPAGGCGNAGTGGSL